MSYLIQSRMAKDAALIGRIGACVATVSAVLRPLAWADDRRVTFMATPGWAAEYAAAEARRDADPDTAPLPGEDETAITDDMIRVEVVKILAAETPPEPEPESPADDAGLSS